jgi:type I restriction enzyme S subunit
MSVESRYTKTENRLIPEGWRNFMLGDVAEVFGGATPSTNVADYWNGDIPFVTPSDVTDLKGSNTLKSTKKGITKAGFNSTSAACIPAGAVLLTSRATIGFCCINKIPVVTNQGFINLVCKDELCNIYALYLIRSLKRELERLSDGSTFKELARRSFRKISIVLPPLAEQHKITSILSIVDDSLQKSDEIITKTQQLKKGLMQQLLTQGIGHMRSKKTELGEVPESWRVVRINQICKVRRGASPRPIEDASYFSKSGRGWIRIVDATSTYKYLKRTSQYLSKKGESKSVEVNPGDLIMSICATIGKPIIVDIPACIHDGFVWFSELSQDMLGEYLFYVLQNKEQDFVKKKQIGTQGNLNTKLVGSTIIVLPPNEEQQKIVEILSTVDNKLEKELLRKEQIDRLKKSLMHDLLTGNVRVKVS